MERSRGPDPVRPVVEALTETRASRTAARERLARFSYRDTIMLECSRLEEDTMKRIVGITAIAVVLAAGVAIAQQPPAQPGPASGQMPQTMAAGPQVMPWDPSSVWKTIPFGDSSMTVFDPVASNPQRVVAPAPAAPAPAVPLPASMGTFATAAGADDMQGGMCPMMGGMMGGAMMGGGMGMMGGQSDSPRMMQMRGEMMKAMGEVMMKYGRMMEGAGK